MSKNKSCASRFWTREEISSLSSQEQLAYLKILTTSSTYDIHGLTVLEHSKKSLKRIEPHRIQKDPIRLLAKKGLVVFDDFNGIVFIPGSTSDIEAQIDSDSEFRKVKAVLKRLPALSRPVQVWALSWFLTNITNTKIAILEDFLQYAQIWIKLIINDANQNKLVDKDKIILSDFVLLDTVDYEVSVDDVMSLIVSEQKCYPGVVDVLKRDVLGDDFQNNLELYIKRRNIYHDSLVYNLLSEFSSLYSEKKGVEYTLSKSYDPRRIAWMVREYGTELVRDRMRLYINSNNFVHSIGDFKNNFQKIGNPDTSDLSKYYEIIGEFENRARGNT